METEAIVQKINDEGLQRNIVRKKEEQAQKIFMKIHLKKITNGLDLGRYKGEVS